MGKPHVYITKRIPANVEKRIAAACTYEMWPKKTIMPREQLLHVVQNVDGLMTTGYAIDDELLSHAPKLKVVSNMAVGYNNFDLEAMRERDVIGTNTPSVLDDTVADLIIGLMLSAARRIVELDRYVRNGKWKKEDDQQLFGVDVHHQTLGIIGMGRIGQKVAQRARFGFEMNIMYHNRRRDETAEQQFNARYATLEEVLEQADFVLVMVPLTAETHHLINAQAFARMKENSIFINASRGATVDENALVEALQSNKIRAAGLDVFENEPVDAQHPLLKMNNVVTLPHIGSATAKTRAKMAHVAADNLLAALQGQCPPNVVTD